MRCAPKAGDPTAIETLEVLRTEKSDLGMLVIEWPNHNMVSTFVHIHVTDGRYLQALETGGERDQRVKLNLLARMGRGQDAVLKRVLPNRATESLRFVCDSVNRSRGYDPRASRDTGGRPRP